MPGNFTPLDSSRPSRRDDDIYFCRGEIRCVRHSSCSTMRKLQKMEHDMETWEFLQHHSGAWYWRHTSSSGAVRTSAVGFECESNCVGNAIYHGYLPHTPHVARPQIAMSL
jgi:hypothetical protein